MMTLDAIADRLGWRTKNRGERVRRLLTRIEEKTGKTILTDFGVEARPRYYVEETVLAEAFPSLVQDIRGDTDERMSELLDELESLRELVLSLSRRIRAIEEDRRRVA